MLVQQNWSEKHWFMLMSLMTNLRLLLHIPRCWNNARGTEEASAMGIVVLGGPRYISEHNLCEEQLESCWSPLTHSFHICFWLLNTKNDNLGSCIITIQQEQDLECIRLGYNNSISPLLQRELYVELFFGCVVLIQVSLVQQGMLLIN